MNTSVEENLICCILLKPSLINELYISEETIRDTQNKKWLNFFKKFYNLKKNLDLTLMVNCFNRESEQHELIDYYTRIIDCSPSVSLFYEYQEEIIEIYKDAKIKEEIAKYSNGKQNIDDLVESINTIQNENCIIKQKNKVTPQEMLQMIRGKNKLIKFNRFDRFNDLLKIKQKTICVIGARPSEGKSALALNLFCDLAKSYKCMYFNMEMTEQEVYERMLGIECDMTIKDVIEPKTEYQNNFVNEMSNRIYTYKYEVVNGSKTIKSLKNKIIKEQRDEHLIVFIDYVGYIVGDKGQNDRERIGNVVRELNNITKDYDCTIFLIAQINRNGSDTPTMQDLKDSGEIEQTADTIILIHDLNKEDTSDVKNINLVIPKCRSGKRNIAIKVEYEKAKQKMSVIE